MSSSSGRSLASSTPAAKVSLAGSPARPPPQRRVPTVTTPAVRASSRWSLAAWRPDRASASSASGERSKVAGSTTSGSTGPPRPMATTTGRRPVATRARASSAATAVFPVRLPVPMTAMDGFRARRGRGGTSKANPAPR